MIHSKLIPNAQFNDSNDSENSNDLEIASMEQSHSDVSIEVDTTGTYKADGLITNKKKLALVVKTADCMPVIISDKEKIGVIHIGWKGLENKIFYKTIAKFNLSELNAAGPEVLFALHSLLDRHKKLELPNGEVISLRDDCYIFGTMNPTSLRDYSGTQTLNKAFADRWVIWDKPFPNKDQLQLIFKKRYPNLQSEFSDLIIKLAIEINNSFMSDDISINIETPMSLRTIVERIPVGLDIYKNSSDPLYEAWKNFVLPHVDTDDMDHYNTLWNTVVRSGPNLKPKL